jgi:hypothetical protein
MLFRQLAGQKAEAHSLGPCEPLFPFPWQPSMRGEGAVLHTIPLPTPPPAGAPQGSWTSRKPARPDWLAFSTVHG